MIDRWESLWKLATGKPGGPATIGPDPERSDQVVLTWPDGSRLASGWSNVGLYWYPIESSGVEIEHGIPGRVC